MKQTIYKKKYNTSILLCEAIRSFFDNSFGVHQLEELHNNRALELLEAGTDQASPFHQAIYREFDKDTDSPLIFNYRVLCLEWLNELHCIYNEEWAIQRYPSVRIHMPGNISVFEFHRDSDYNHQLGEVNHFLSVTASRRSAALHVENNLGWNDFAPLELAAGESAILNTSAFRHGDYINNEAYTRLSLDFRAIPHCLLKDVDSKQSLSKKKALDDTDYFIRATHIDIG